MKRLNIKIYGIVQGVGFRPFMSRLADACRIRGTVCNKGPYVEVFAEGRDASLQQFVAGIPEQAPERAAILKVDVHDVTDDDAAPYEDFSIIESAKERGDIFVSPDIATCDKCRAELFDPHDRRYLHPFINCTACGPRLTILEAMPYDRERTSMKEFPMCKACHEEYVSPESRRYDAQPVCCNDCGPEVYLLGHEAVRGAAAIKEVRRVLAASGIAAIKGIGGFHLACDATNEAAVKRLRALKHRPQKPFAVMMRDEAAVRSACHLEPGEEAMMTGHQKPILLLRRRQDSPLAPSVAPGNPKVGVMLPYAPVQMLIFDYPGDTSEVPAMLVMTSGNPSGAPICHNDAEAQEALAPLCDVILSHDRRIRLRADDSVMDWFEEKPYMVRRSRGFAPLPFMLSAPLKGQVLGIGGELLRRHGIHRQQELDALCLGLLDHLERVGALVLLEQGLADLAALRLGEGVGHAAADDDGVGLFKQIVDNGDLIADLCAAEHGDERALGIVERLAHDLKLLGNKETGHGGKIRRYARSGGVGAVHRAERVGDVQLRHRGKGLGELGVVLGLARFKTGVFKQHDLAALERRGLGLGVHADDVVREDDILAQKLGQALGDGRKRQLVEGLFPLLLGQRRGVLALFGLLFHPLVKLGLGLAEVGAGDDRRAVVEQIPDGRQRGHDALIRGDLAGLLVLGHVEIAAQQHLLAAHVHIENSLLVIIHVVSSS